MKKYRHLIMGIIIGALTMVSVGVIANTGGTAKVSAWLVDNVKFTFDGEFREVPDEYGVLIYEDRTYVPARFVANNLGAEVAWDDTSRTVIITSKPCPVCETTETDDDEIDKEQVEEEGLTEQEQQEEITEQDEGQPKGDYRRLPQTRYFDNMEVTVTLVNLTNDKGIEYGKDIPASQTRAYVRLENKDNVPLQLEQSKIKAIVDGTEYTTKKIPSYQLDTKWYKDIRKDDVVEGYIVLPLIPEDAKEMKLTLSVLENDWRQMEREIEFDIALDLD